MYLLTPTGGQSHIEFYLPPDWGVVPSSNILWGTREVTQSILAGFYARRVFSIGQPIEIQGQRGTLKAITPTLTLLDQDGKTVSVANTVFLRQAVKQ